MKSLRTNTPRTYSGASVTMPFFVQVKTRMVKWKNIPSSLLITNTEQTYQCNWKSPMLMQKHLWLENAQKWLHRWVSLIFGIIIFLHLTCKCNYSDKSEWEVASKYKKLYFSLNWFDHFFSKEAVMDCMVICCLQASYKVEMPNIKTVFCTEDQKFLFLNWDFLGPIFL